MSGLDLEELARRCDLRDAKVRSIMANDNMSVQSQAIAISMVVGLDLDIFRDCAAALRARAESQSRPPSTCSRWAGRSV